MLALYGLKNCDTCRKARAWLETESIPYEFHDLREAQLSREKLLAWAAQTGWERLLNKASTTWRGLEPSDKEDLDTEKAVALLEAHPALIKRPVFEKASSVQNGFRPADRQALKDFLAG